MPTTTLGESNGGPKSRLPVYRSTTSSGSPTNLKRTNDELRQHIARLKSELEIEKAKSKQVHRDKVADIKRLKDEYDREKKLAAGSVVQRQKTEHEYEIKKLRESLQKEKDVEIKQIIRFKDEELKTTKKMLIEDKEFALRELEEKLKRELTSKNKDVNDNDFKLRQEIIDFKKQKNQIEELNKQKAQSETDKVEMIRKLKEDHDKETQRVIRDARVQIARNVHELKAAQKALSEKEQQITKREFELTKLEEEKEYLSDKLRTDSRRLGDPMDGSSVRSEREKELHMKNVELRKSLDEMTRKIGHMEKDNLLKRSENKEVDQSARAEQRIKELKKRNGELVTLAKKLEEKAKRLQDELKEIKSKGTPTRNVPSESPAAFDNFKKSFTLQRARDLAENAKSAISKDKLIAQLKEKVAALEKHDNEKSHTDDSLHVKKLESTIQQMEKEKLKLEKQILNRSIKSPNLSSKSPEEDRLRKNLESAERERDNLNRLVDEQKEENELLKTQHLKTQSLEERNLRKNLESTKTEKDALQKLVDEQNEMNRLLKTQVEDLSEKSEKCDALAYQLEERDEECRALAENLRLAEKEIQKLKDILTDTERINKKLENEQEKSKHVAKSLKKKMADMSKRLVEMQSFELECNMLKDRLQDTETKFMMMQGQLESLQSKVTQFKTLEQNFEESEEKCKKWERDYDYAVNQINKQNKEISSLQEAQDANKRTHDSEVKELQNEISRLEDFCSELESKEKDYKQMLLETSKAPSRSTANNIDVYVQTSRPHTPVQAQRDVIAEEIVPSFDDMFESSNKIDENSVNIERPLDVVEEAVYDFGNDNSSKCDDDILNIASSRIAALAINSSSEEDFSREDKPESAKFDDLGDNNVEDEKIKPDGDGEDLHRRDSDRGSDTSDELTLSLDEMESDEENFEISLENNNEKLESETNGPKSDRVIANGLSHKSSAVKRLDYQKTRGSEDSLFAPITPQSSVDEFVSEKNKRNQANASGNEIMSKQADELTVFIAKYTYDPYQHSPNEDPGLELFLQAGDFVYVFGSADEDGFYTGELVNGQRGLVPSNFVEKVPDESELLAQNANAHDGYPGDTSDEDLTEVSGSISPTDFVENFQQIQSLESDVPLDAEYLKNTKTPTYTNTQNIADALDLSSLNESEADDEADPVGFSPPRKLTLERQLNNSIVLSWLPPDSIPENAIYGYAVKADGILKQTLIGAGRTKAIVSDIQRDRVYRMSVHTINKQEKESQHSVATITVGRGASAVPSELQIKNRSPRSADLEWRCGNSSLAHVICIDDKEVHVVKPGIDRFCLSNLDPDTEYEVIVEARKSKDIHKKPKGVIWKSDRLTFRTLEEGLPEPPLNVQVQMNSSKSRLGGNPSLLISWLPVTITNVGTSNGAIIQGYKVYLNDQEISYVDWATVDHVVVPCDRLRGLVDWAGSAVAVWVTSKFSVGESPRSNVVAVGEDIVRKMTSLVAEEAPVSLVAEEAHMSLGAKEEQSNMTVNNQTDKFDINRKNSDVNRKIDLINELVEEEKPVTAVIREQVEKLPASSSDIDDSLASYIPQRKTQSGPSTEVSVIREEAPTQRVKGKSTVVMYDVTDSDDSSDDHVDTESDDEIQHGYKEAENKVHELEREMSTERDRDVIAEDGIKLTREPSGPPESNPAENLILPEIPSPDYDDAEEVRPAIRISFDDLLSDDSELSAIEEETVEDLIEYNNEEDRSISPGNTFSIENEPELGPDEIPGNEETNDSDVLKIPDDAKAENNRTYSIHSDDVPGDPVQIEKEIDSSVKISRSSKDTPTFSSDDVVDILDKDVIGGIPDLPMDETKVTGGKEKPVSFADRYGLDKSSKENGKEHVPKVIETAEVPAKRAPVPTNDQEMVNKDVCLPSQAMPTKQETLSGKDVDSLKSSQTRYAESTNVVCPENSEVRDSAGLSEKDIAINAESLELNGREVVKTSDIGINKAKNGTNENTKENIEISGENLTTSMGQTLDYMSDKIDDDFDDNESEGGTIKIPKASIHDLYNLHAGGSFDDSTLDSEPSYQPDFGGEELLQTQTGNINNESDVIDETLTSPFIEKPAVESSLSAVDMSIVEAGQSNNNTDNNDSSVEGTRSNHVLHESNADNVRVFIALFSYDPITMSPNTDGVDEELTFREGDLIKIFGDVDEDGFYYGELEDVRGFVPSNMVQEVSLNNIDKSINIPPPPDKEDSSTDIEEPTSQTHSSSRRQSSVSTKNQNQVGSSESVRNKDTEIEPITSKHQNKPNNLVPAMSNTQKRDSGVADVAMDLDGIKIEEDAKYCRYISERESIYCLPPRRMIALYDYDPTISSPNVDSEVELAFSKGEILFVFGDMDEDGFFAAQSESERGLVPSNFFEECPEEPEEIEINMGAASPSIKSSSRKSSSSSIGAASPVDSGKKKKKGFLAKGKKIFSKLKGK